MPHPIFFRLARPDDAPAIRAIIARIYADYGDVLDTEREDPHLEHPCDYFRSHAGELWVAEGDGVVAGSGGIVLKTTAQPSFHDVCLSKDEFEIKTVYVAHEFRRRGIARRLVTMAIDYARHSGWPRVMLWSDTRFVEAHRLYESMGFIRGEKRDIKIVNTFSEYRYDLMF
ncbi:MAG: GNAT family N-acetyltransferase [Pyrinomonadaceae bacterium]|nr:GNAT family N-acetyltransferase [Phycisphaerales bacterium]